MHGSCRRAIYSWLCRIRPVQEEVDWFRVQRRDCGDDNVGLCWSRTSALLPHPHEPDFTSLFHKSLIYSRHHSQWGLISCGSLDDGSVLDSLLVHPTRRVHIHAAAVLQFVHSAKSLTAWAAETTSALIIARLATVSWVRLIHEWPCWLLKRKLILFWMHVIFFLIKLWCCLGFFFFFLPLVLLPTTWMEHVLES